MLLSTSSTTPNQSNYNGSLFDPNLLTTQIVGELPKDIIVRPLNISDYDKGFLEVLGQLTTVGEVSREAFEKRFCTMRDTVPKSYYVIVIEHQGLDRVVGAATLVLEWKFIHDAGCRGRVEDVVIDKNMRGRNLGAVLNKTLVGLAKQIGMYKLSLECKNSLIGFYELFGFKKDEDNNFLVQRFSNDIKDIRILSL